MAGTIKISSDLDARGFLKGTSNMEEALEDVSKELDQTGKDGVKDVDKLENKFVEAAKAAKDAGEDMRKGIGEGTKKGTQQAETATDVYKKEAIANVSEVTSSFTGSWESAADAVQGTLGGVVADLGPTGAALGAAGAVGVGLLTAALVKMEEDAKKAQERISELGLEMIDAGSNGEIPLETIAANLQEIITNSEEATKKFQDITRASKFLNTSVEQTALAYAGNKEAIEAQLDVLEDLIKAGEEETELMSENASRFGTVSVAKVESLKTQQAELQKIQEETEAAAAIEQAWLQSGGAEIQAKAAAIETIDAAYDDAAGSILDFKNEESGVLDVQAYIDSMIARETALADYQTAVAESGFSTEQKTALNDMGIEASAAWMQGYKQASPAQQKEMERILTKSASDSSGVAVKAMDKAFEKPVKAKVEVSADIADAERGLENLIRSRTAVIKVDFQDRNGKRVY
jgi:hypothetical protein